MNNEMIWKIQVVIMIKKIESFYSKYHKSFSDINIREVFFEEFNINSEFSDEYIYFLDYLIKKEDVIKN